GGEVESSHNHLVSWDRVCSPKGNGGLGLRKARIMNVALLVKTGWKLHARQQSLCTEVFEKKYLRGLGFMDADARGRQSSTWRGIRRSIDCVRNGYKWNIENDASVNF
ncbi:putative ribonuclease H protein, partial [Corchorus olitorius]